MLTASKKMVLPILYTGLTNFCAFLSLIFSGIKHIYCILCQVLAIGTFWETKSSQNRMSIGQKVISTQSQKMIKNVTSPHICDNINLCTTQPIVSGTIFITLCS